MVCCSSVVNDGMVNERMLVQISKYFIHKPLSQNLRAEAAITHDRQYCSFGSKTYMPKYQWNALLIGWFDQTSADNEHKGWTVMFVLKVYGNSLSTLTTDLLVSFTALLLLSLVLLLWLLLAYCYTRFYVVISFIKG